MPIALASSTIRWRRSSNLDAAPEKLNAISSPQQAEHRALGRPGSLCQPAGVARKSRNADTTAHLGEHEHAAEQTGDQERCDEDEFHAAYSALTFQPIVSQLCPYHGMPWRTTLARLKSPKNKGFFVSSN